MGFVISRPRCLQSPNPAHKPKSHWKAASSTAGVTTPSPLRRYPNRDHRKPHKKNNKQTKHNYYLTTLHIGTTHHLCNQVPKREAF